MIIVIKHVIKNQLNEAALINYEYYMNTRCIYQVNNVILGKNENLKT